MHLLCGRFDSAYAQPSVPLIACPLLLAYPQPSRPLLHPHNEVNDRSISATKLTILIPTTTYLPFTTKINSSLPPRFPPLTYLHHVVTIPLSFSPPEDEHSPYSVPPPSPLLPQALLPPQIGRECIDLPVRLCWSNPI